VAYKITRILEILSDGKWHGIEEMRKQLDLNKSEIREVTKFLNEYDFAEVDDANKRIRVARDFQKIPA
jgi:DNA-binding IclR family transcriptional regulator